MVAIAAANDAQGGDALRIVVGVTGGIAAYKAVSVIRALVLAGHDVEVIATEHALRFVGKPTLEAISRHPLRTDLYENVATVQHVALGQSADVVAVVPATANTLAKFANGLADDLLTNTVLAARAPIVVAPAMHTEMWQHPATQANVRVLESRGVTVVGPASGQLTGNDSGPGRLAEPDEIVLAILAAAQRGTDAQPVQDLAGRRVLVTAGGTREPIDPVRFLGNRSTGKQGVAIAAAAAKRGASVTLIAANLEVPPPAGVELEEVSTAAELADACRELGPSADVVVMTAAVADFRPETIAEGKIKKEDTGDRLTMTFVKNPDILRELADARYPGQLIVGFAAETEPDLERRLDIARVKIARKGADLLVLNHVGWNHGFQQDVNEVHILDLPGNVVVQARGDKRSVADAIMDAVVARL